MNPPFNPSQKKNKAKREKKRRGREEGGAAEAAMAGPSQSTPASTVLARDRPQAPDQAQSTRPAASLPPAIEQGLASLALRPAPAPTPQPTPLAAETSDADRSARALAAHSKKLSSIDLPGQGRRGRLAANFLEVSVGDLDTLYRYTLTITRVDEVKETPPGTAAPRRETIPVRICRRVIFILLDDLRAAGAGKLIASNYKNQLITTSPLKVSGIPGTWSVSYCEEDQRRAPLSGPQYDVHISDGSKIPLRAGADYLRNRTSTHASFVNDETALPFLNSISDALNTIFSHSAYQYMLRNPDVDQSVASIGPNRFFNLAPSTSLWPDLYRNRPPWKDLSNVYSQGGLEAVPGFFRSTRASMGSNILLNINTTTGAFYQPINLHALIRMQDGNLSDLNRIRRFIHGLRVKTMSAGCPGTVPGKIHTVIGLADRSGSSTAASFLVNADGGTEKDKSLVPFREFFHRKHGVDLHQYDLIVRLDYIRPPLHLPAKLFEVLTGQNYRQKTEMVREATRLPELNRSLIEKDGLWLFGIHPPERESGCAAFGLKVSNDMVTVDAQILAPQPVVYGDNKEVLAENTREGFWNLAAKRFVVPARAKNWSTIEIVEGTSKIGPHGTQNSSLDEFVKAFESNLRNYGINGCQYISPPTRKLYLGDILVGTDESRDDARYRVIKAKLEQINAMLIVVLLPKKDTNLYSIVKRVGDQELGLHTICHYCRDVTNREGRRLYWGPKMDPGFLANLYLKFNLKLNPSGANQTLRYKGSILTDKTMMIGIDVTHSGVGALKNAPSIAAVVGSVDEHFAQWPASLAENPRVRSDDGMSMEEITVLTPMITSRLERYKAANGNALPHQIIIFRDGVSEGQFEMARTRELPQIMTAISDVYGSTSRAPSSPRIMLVCAVKRGHCRFFPVSGGYKDKNLLDKNSNPKPGCFVHTKVTYGDNQDFYLISHKALLGTAKPTHYKVLYNEFDTTVQEVGKMVHSLCYLFGRSTTSVSLVPAAYYADLAARRARYYVTETYKPAVPGDFVPGNFDLTVSAPLRHSMFYI